MICWTKAADDCAACPKTSKVVKLKMRVLQYSSVYLSCVVQPFMRDGSHVAQQNIFVA